jgi:lipopolysaccharide export system permease protein
MALPLSVLLSSIMTMGNMGQHNELMSLKAAGISLPRILMPLVIFIMFVALGAFYFANNVMPYTNLKMGVLLHDVRQQKPEVSIKEGVFSDALEGLSIKVSRKNKETGMLYDLLIYDHSESNGNREVTVADSATLKLSGDGQFMILTMYNGHSYSEVEEKRKKRVDKEYPHRMDKFQEERIMIDMGGLGFERTDENLFKSHYQMLNLVQLEHTIDTLHRTFNVRRDVFVNNMKRSNYFKRVPIASKDSFYYEIDTIPTAALNVDSLFLSLDAVKKKSAVDYAKSFARTTKSFVGSSQTDFKHKAEWIFRHEIEWHRKFTLPFACVILFFVGAPLGAIIRKGGLGMPVIISVLFFVIYYVISISGEKSARIGASPAWWGMWMAGIIILPISLFLTYKAATDSVILDVATYVRPIKAIIKFFKKLFSKKTNNDIDEDL